MSLKFEVTIKKNILNAMTIPGRIDTVKEAKELTKKLRNVITEINPKYKVLPGKITEWENEDD